MLQIIDRRANGRNKSVVNRQRFMRRFRAQIRKAAADAIAGRSVTDTSSGERIGIPAGDTREPFFRHGRGGSQESVHPGNKEFIAGDEIDRPRGANSGGMGEGASNDGQGEDTFAFEISNDEFLDLFFADLELPNLRKTELCSLIESQSVRAGHAREGIPGSIDVVRSLTQALGRRMALQSAHRRKLRDIELEIEEACDGDASSNLIEDLEHEAQKLRGRMARVPFIDTFDLRFHNRVERPKPKSQAVMFCLMDVSGSMDMRRKDIAKRFFILLYFFLTRAYEHIQVVFIRHHSTAEEVDEETFFTARETGGTVVSSALELMQTIVKERYPLADWNIYAAQASDGDNWQDDSGRCCHLLENSLLETCQYFAYVQIACEREQQLWVDYELIAQKHPHFVMRKINDRTDIYPVFRQLMQKRDARA